jgi:hypothetical protein
MMLHAETAGNNPAARREDPDDLGERTTDWGYNWSLHVNTYREDRLDILPQSQQAYPEMNLPASPRIMPDIHAGNHWWARAKELYPVRSRVDFYSQSVIDRLSPEQRLIYDKVMSHYDSNSSQPLLLNIDGRAGTGKSFIIQVLSSHLENRAHREIIVRCAPTGAASYGIQGSTLHYMFKLPVNRPFEALAPAAAQALQASLARVKYLIIDEKSMVSLRVLHYVDLRLQQAFATESRFGGLSILLFGDFWQLPPVRDKAMYFNPRAVPFRTNDAPFGRENAEEAEPIARPPNHTAALNSMHPEDWLGLQAYHRFSQSIELTVQQRQDPLQVEFAAALEGLRNSDVTVSHWETLSSRCQVRLSFPKYSLLLRMVNINF